MLATQQWVRAGLALATPEARVGAPDSIQGSEPAAQSTSPVCSLTSGQQVTQGLMVLRLQWVQCSPHRSPSTPYSLPRPREGPLIHTVMVPAQSPTPL